MANTGQFGWPGCFIPYVIQNGKCFLEAEQCLKVLGLFKRKEIRGWVPFDKCFNENGIVVRDEIICSGRNNNRTHISLLCFTTLLIGGGYLRDSEEQLTKYIPDLDDFNVNKLYELRDFITNTCLAALIGQPNERHRQHPPNAHKQNLETTTNIVSKIVAAGDPTQGPSAN